MNLLKPVTNVKLVDIDKLTANDYNPNRVNKKNLDLLEQSILVNGWTLPIVVKPDYTIIDGYHRWTIAKNRLRKKLGNKVPVVIVSHKDKSKDIYGTITHNRARGAHLLEPMKKIIKRLIDEGKTIEEISKQLGMENEEVFRLSEIDKKTFLNLLKGENYSKATLYLKY